VEELRLQHLSLLLERRQEALFRVAIARRALFERLQERPPHSRLIIHDEALVRPPLLLRPVPLLARVVHDGCSAGDRHEERFVEVYGEAVGKAGCLGDGERGDGQEVVAGARVGREAHAEEGEHLLVRPRDEGCLARDEESAVGAEHAGVHMANEVVHVHRSAVDDERVRRDREAAQQPQKRRMASCRCSTSCGWRAPLGVAVFGVVRRRGGQCPCGKVAHRRLPRVRRTREQCV
jgi:hypothetical protein